ncbi:MAG TPA: lysophospholipid acyltransferase family protein [Verrucomicrobiae bacterium]|nr:lysophospholipid acyltransferase family protein [Verrucomicrobiae bacterium]
MRLGFWLLYYGIGWSLFTVILRVVFRARITGRHRVPLDDGLLIVCNHISFADPPLLAITTPRPVEFMTMAEMFRKPWMGRSLRAVGCFPVDRSRVDQRAVREAIRRLRNGRCVVIFPEGGIRLTQKSVLGGDPDIKPGAGAIALLGRAPILPVIVRDTRKPYAPRNWLPFHEGRLRRETVGITFGQPFCLWNPRDLPADQCRERAESLVREQLLKTVELN